MAGTKVTTAPVTQNGVNPAVTLNAASSFTATNPGTAPTNTVLLATAGANDTSLRAIMAASNDTVAQQIMIWFSPDGGTTKYLLNTVNVPTLSGIGAGGITPNVDLLGASTWVGMPLGLDGRPSLLLAGGSNTKIYVSCANQAVSANKNVWLVGVQEDY